MTIRTGIGGWTYAPWRGAFYPVGLRHADELAYAAAHLGAIEINATFYRLQSAATFAKWRAQTPEGFVFAIKGSRYVVTRPRLADAGEGVARFCAQGIAELGDRLGPVLWQMPATRRFDAEDIAAFLALLPREVAGLPLRHAIEAGHESFACEEFVAVAREVGVAIVWTDATAAPQIDAATADFAYARFKTAHPRYKRGYAPAALTRMAQMLRAWDADGRAVFAFAINGAKERAPAAALALAREVTSPRSRAAPGSARTTRSTSRA